jgi:hypothetical protein
MIAELPWDFCTALLTLLAAALAGLWAQTFLLTGVISRTEV